LLYADFRWVDISNFNVIDVAIDFPTGYILEIDLEYPHDLYDAHADLLFCPTRDKPPSKWENKLLATLYNKKRYILSKFAAMYSFWSSGNKDSPYIEIRAIFMASRLYPTKYRFQNSHEQCF